MIATIRLAVDVRIDEVDQQKIHEIATDITQGAVHRRVVINPAKKSIQLTLYSEDEKVIKDIKNINHFKKKIQKTKKKVSKIKI